MIMVRDRFSGHCRVEQANGFFYVALFQAQGVLKATNQGVSVFQVLLEIEYVLFEILHLRVSRTNFYGLGALKFGFYFHLIPPGTASTSRPSAEIFSRQGTRLLRPLLQSLELLAGVHQHVFRGDYFGHGADYCVDKTLAPSEFIGFVLMSQCGR